MGKKNARRAGALSVIKTRARWVFLTILHHIFPSRPARPYYLAHVRQGFIAFGDEVDEERLAQIEARAAQDAAWVLKKVREMGLRGGGRVKHKGANLHLSLTHTHASTPTRPPPRPGPGPEDI